MTLRTNAPAGGTDAVALSTPVTVAPTVPGSDGPATDVDGDGLLEDVDGSGTFTVIDVAVFLDRFDEPAVRENAALFDFTGDGTLDVLDVAELLAAV